MASTLAIPAAPRKGFLMNGGVDRTSRKAKKHALQHANGALQEGAGCGFPFDVSTQRVKHRHRIAKLHQEFANLHVFLCKKVHKMREKTAIVSSCAAVMRFCSI